MQQIQIPPLAEGEVYACGIVDRSGDVEHIVLLPGENIGASQPKQLEWAKSIGGDLPTLAEQALMHERCPNEFKKVAYWSKRNDGDGWAWYTYFYSGDQDLSDQYDQLPARAVRRIKN
jgi:hypothetical protein